MAVIFLEDVVLALEESPTPPPRLPTVSTAVPTWDVELAVTSVLDHVFTIGVSTIGGTDVIGGGLTPQFKNITADVMNWTVKRGRNANLDAQMQGTASLTLTDPKGKYNPSGGYLSGVLADQPVGYWRQNELSGTAMGDGSAFGNLGAYNGGFLLGQGGATIDGDAAVQYNGVDAYGSVPDSSSLRLAKSLSVEAWFKTTTTANQTIVCKDTQAATRYAWGLRIGRTAPGTLEFFYYNGTTFAVTKASVNDGAYHHAVGTISGTTLSLYVDNVLVGTTTITGTQGAPTDELDVGANPPFGAGPSARANFFNGYVDEVAVYSYPLTASRVSAHNTAAGYYGTGIRPMMPLKINGTFWDYVTSVIADAPTLWWRFSDALTSVLAADSSGAGLPGTVTGPVRFQQQSIIVDSSPAAKFNGLDTYISVPYSANLGFTNALTVEMWLRFDTVAAGGVAGQVLDATHKWSLSVVGLSAGGFGLQWSIITGGGPILLTSGPLQAAQWYHVVATFDGARLKLWINDFLYGSIAASTTLSLSGSTVYVGQDGLGSYSPPVTIDEFALYNTVLPSYRVDAHFASGVGYGGDTRLFHVYYGFTDRPEHDSAPNAQQTIITCVDMWELLNRVKPVISTQYAQRADQLISTILSVVPITDPDFINLQPGADTITAWGDAVSGDNTVIQLFENIQVTDQGLFFVKGSGALSYINRSGRYGTPVPVAIWDGVILSDGTKPSADKQLIYNHCQAVRQYSQQTLSITGSPSGGTITLTLDGQTTATIPFNGTAGQVETALKALGNVGVNGVTCTGGPLSTNPVICNFVGFRISMVIGTNALSGGTSPTPAISAAMVESAVQTTDDVQSQKNFGRRDFTSVSSSNWNNDSQPNSFVTFIVLNNSISRPPLRNAMIINGAGKDGLNEAPRRMWQILARELADPIAVDLTQGAHGGGTYEQGAIQSIQIDAQNAGRVVSGRYTIQPVALPSGGAFFTIGVSKIGGADVLGY